MALTEPMRGDNERMAGEAPVGGEQFETLLLSLDEQQFVERVLVIERWLNRPCRMDDRHRQERHVLIFEGDEYVVRSETALARP